VLIGFVIACLLAGSPTFLSPPSVKATIDGVVLLPSLLMITAGALPYITATQLLVVPRSIPIIFPIIYLLYIFIYFFSVLSRQIIAGYISHKAKIVPKSKCDIVAEILSYHFYLVALQQMPKSLTVITTP
jgi:hypothetical protein